MSAADTIWTALIILMTVCVYVDSGLTVFSGIQIFELAEMFLFLLRPNWSVLSAVFTVNLMLGMIALFCTKRYRASRVVLAVDLILMAKIFWNHLQGGVVIDIEHYVNQAFILVLLFESVRSFFTQRSLNNVQREASTEARGRKSSSKTPTSSSQPRLAFIRGLY